MYFTTVTTKATALAIVAMAASHVAIIRVAAAPVALSQADYLRNGQDAQQANKQFEGVTVEDPCNAGEKACIGGNFAVCSPENDWEVTPCPESLQCFSLPTTSGTTISCAAQDDAQAWIEDTGAKGGINGDGSPDDHDHGDGDEGEGSSTLGATATTSAVETGTSSTGLPTVTSTPNASDIPAINIPLGDALSDQLPTTTTDAAAANSTLSGTETTTTYSTSTVTDASDGSNTVSTSEASSAANGRFTTRLTTTVIVTPTECSSIDVSESSGAQDTTTAPSLVTFTTNPFSPIPVSTSSYASDATSSYTSDATSSYATDATSSYASDATSTSAGYVIGSSSAAPVTATPTNSVSFITLTGAQSFPIGGTLTTIPLSDLPAASASSSTTSDVPAYSYSSEPSIPPMGVAPTPDVIVLPPTFTPI